MKSSILIWLVVGICTAQTHPTLPTRWVATTNEPGVGIGVESYKFVAKPSDANPSAMWSNYTDQGCNRLIYVGTGNNKHRYLFGCDAINCCNEPQAANQVEFQITNQHSQKEPVVTHATEDVTTKFETLTGADSWSWANNPIIKKLSQSWKAYTTTSDDPSAIQLHRWTVSTPIAANYSLVHIDFVNFTHIADADVPAFDASFTPPLHKDCRIACGSAVEQGLLKQDTYDNMLGRPTLLDHPHATNLDPPTGTFCGSMIGIIKENMTVHADNTFDYFNDVNIAKVHVACTGEKFAWDGSGSMDISAALADPNDCLTKSTASDKKSVPTFTWNGKTIASKNGYGTIKMKPC